MDFDQFYIKQDATACDCSSRVQLTVAAICFSYLVLKCMYQSHTESKKIAEIKTENENLKNLILKSVDNAFMKMMKNGYESDNENNN